MRTFSSTHPEHSAGSASYPVHAVIPGRVILIGLGSIGKGVLTLLERHIDFDHTQLTVIDPDQKVKQFLAKTEYSVLTEAVTPENYVDLIGPLLDTPGAFCINLSVNTSSRDLIALCQMRRALYIDTVVEPWPGFYFDVRPNERRTNYALREDIRKLAHDYPCGTTAVSCCGANPGMVSWFVKEALLRLAADMGREIVVPNKREGWAYLMRDLGVQGIHIAERDTQVSVTARERGSFVNTWSVDGFLSEAYQPAELSFGTHEDWVPEDANTHSEGCRASIWLNRPGAETRVRTWCPTHGPQYGLLITHNEAISLAHYFSIGAEDAPTYRPTCLLRDLPQADRLLADRGYDADWYREALKDRGIRVCIPGRKNRKKKIRHDRRRYKRRNRIEIMFGRLKDWRRIATRYDRCPKVFLSAIALAATVIFWL